MTVKWEKGFPPQLWSHTALGEANVVPSALWPLLEPRAQAALSGLWAPRGHPLCAWGQTQASAPSDHCPPSLGWAAKGF